jgi:hypothetical protein
MQLIPVYRILFLVTLLFPSLPAYAGDNFPDFPVRPADDYPVKAQAAGVTIGAQAVDEKEDQKNYFHTELSSSGFVPVFVVIQNRSKDDSLLFDKAAITYGVGNSSIIAKPKAGTKGAKTVEFASAAALTYGVVGDFVAVAMFAKASRIQQNLVVKEIQSGTLGPGEAAHGFLYIPASKKGPREKIHLQFTVTWVGSGKTSVLDVTL